ncbi:MAG: tautomerase family protein [Clostridiaceae bacterium]|nr:tautomerase family protein [Clostridiaceae bacterium]
MPYINSTLTVKVTDEKKEIIKSKLGEIITEIPGKSEEWLMVGFKDDHTLFFRGERKEKAAFVEIKIFGTTDKKYKEVITSKVSILIEEELNIPKDSIYITFEEVKDWGWNGSMF